MDEVQSGTFAARSGVEAGDQIVSVNGVSTGDWEKFQNTVSEKEPGEEATLVVERNGTERTFTGELSENPQNPGSALVGVQPVAETVTYGPFESVWLGVERTATITVVYMGGLYQLITGELNFMENVSSPVGIVGISSETVQQGHVSTVFGVHQPRTGNNELATYSAARWWTLDVHSGGKR